MPSQQNLSMPGPDFGGNKSSGWIKNNYHRIVSLLIIALIIAGALYFYRSYQPRPALLEPTLNQIIASQSGPTPTPTSTGRIKTNDEVKSVISNLTPKIEKSNDRIVTTAAKGNGATHLARQALKEYLKDKPELAKKLGPEQRIYIEDYLRKNLDNQSKTLHAGDQLTFPNNNIQSAIDKALTLNYSQIKNLGQYVSLVPSL